MPAQNRFTPSFAERNRQSRVARGLEKDHPVFVSYLEPVRRGTIATWHDDNVADQRFLIDPYGYRSTITARFRTTINVVDPGLTVGINDLGWHTRRITPGDIQPMPVSDKHDLTPKELNNITTIDNYNYEEKPVDFWVPQSASIKLIALMDTPHIVSTLRVIWNHTRVTQIEPVKRYIFDRRVYTPWYIAQVTTALIHELRKRLATTGGITGCTEVLKADWANRSLISSIGLLEAQQ